MVPALEATLADLGVDLHAAAQRRARPRRPPEQDAACVLRRDRDTRAGDPRDQAAGRTRRLARALPRGRSHRALRAHVRVADDGREATRRQRRHRGLGDAARAPHDRPGVADAATRLPPAAGVRGRRRNAAAVARAPLLREAHLRDRVPRRAGRDGDASAIRRAAQRRVEGHAERHGLSRRHRRRLLRVAVPSRVGVRGAAAHVPAREVRQRRGSRTRRRAR